MGPPFKFVTVPLDGIPSFCSINSINRRRLHLLSHSPTTRYFPVPSLSPCFCRSWPANTRFPLFPLSEALPLDTFKTNPLKLCLTLTVSSAYSLYKLSENVNKGLLVLMEFSLLLAECRSRWSSTFVQKIDLSTLTFHCFLETEREDKNSFFSCSFPYLSQEKRDAKIICAAAEKHKVADNMCLKPYKYLIPLYTPAEDCIYMCSETEWFKQPHFCPHHNLVLKPLSFWPFYL